MVESRKDGWHLSGLLDPIGSKFSDVECELAYMIHVWLFDGQPYLHLAAETATAIIVNTR
jgi:hypothetical protein